MKRLLSILMVLVMVFSMLPVQALASEADGTEPPVITGEPAPTEAPVSVEEAPTEAPVPEEGTPSEAPVPVEPAPTEAPVTTEPDPTEAPVTTEPDPTEAPATTEPAPTEAPATTEPAPTEAPVATEPAPTEAPVATEPAPTEAPVTVEFTVTEPPVTEEPALSLEGSTPTTEPAERICEDGCILEGEEEHLENGGQCFVWISCTATEGCEGPEGHEGECYGAALLAAEPLVIHYFLASPGNITNPNGTYVNYYGPDKSLSWWPESYAVANIQDLDAWDQIFTQQGIRNVYDEDIVTQYVASWPAGYNAATFKDFGSVRIGGTTYYDTDYEIKWVSVMCRNNASSNWGLRCSQSSFQGDHIHIDGLLVEKIQPGEMLVFKAIPEAAAAETTFQFTLQKMRQPNLTTPPTSADAVDTSFAPMTLIASIPRGQTEAQITGGSEISFGYYKLTENSSLDWQMDGIVLTDSRGRTQTVDADALYICIAPNGTVQYSSTPSGPYSTMNHVAVQNERKPVTVTYQWRVYNLDGSVSEDLPASVGAHGLPATVTDVKIGTNYVYNTGYVEGTSYHDYENGLLYTFHGWDTYSHSSVFNTDPSAAGYTALDDGDAIAGNNKTIPMTANTWINGYWTVSELPAADAYLLVHKDVVVSSGDAQYVNNYLQNTGKLFLSIDPGIDKDGDGRSQIDVDFPGAVAEGGYRINVYQYAVPFVFTEHQAEVPGYTRTVDITVSGSNLTLTAKNGDEATVALTQEFDPAQAPYNLGTVTYTNTYTKNVGTPVAEYPALTLVKRATDTGLQQEGAVFSLYRDANLSDLAATYTTDDEGIAAIDFQALLAGTSGVQTFYLQETAAPDGYLVDNAVYTLTLTPSAKEELRNDEFVTVTAYALQIAVPADSTAEPIQSMADAQQYSLNVFNNPILGQVTVTKTATGLNETDKELLEATVTIHGPITRNGQGQITGLGKEYTLILNSENDWTKIQSQLPLGEYLIHENLASVHGYTWDMENVVYGALETEVYNNITSGVFEITANSTDLALTITNTYSKWESAGFEIYKVDPSGAHLGDAAFQLYLDEACTLKVADPGVTTSAVTGTNGIAWFSGFTVPANDSDGIVTYYLQETKAPAGHYLSSTVYRVDIKAVTDAEGTTTFEPKISVKLNGNWVESADFSNISDTLTIVNTPVKGQITITKQMNGAPDDLTSVTFYVSGPNGYAKTVELTRNGNWTTTLTGLSLGQYTIIEQNAEAPGYDLVTTYEVDGSETTDKATVVLKETNPGKTTGNTVFVGEAKIFNTYTRRETTVENPTSLTVKKVGEDGTTPLAGAVFTLVRERDGVEVSYTTNANGEVTFSFLSGTIENGQVVEGKYTLTETTPPAGYAATDTEWEITVKEKDGQVTIKLNENTNIFENIWDWIIGDIHDGESGYSFENNVLKIMNVELADMTISKDFDGAVPPAGAVIEVAVFDSNGGLVRQVELTEANSWTAKLEDLPADTYTIRETSPSLHGYAWQSAAFTVTGAAEEDVTAAGSSVEVKVANSADVKVEILNSYTVWDAADFYVMKTMADGVTPLQGAKFNLYDAQGNDVTSQYLHIDGSIHTNNGNATGTGGILHFHNFKVDAGKTAQFTLKETAPANYYENTNVYKIVVSHTDNGYDMDITSENGAALTVENDQALFNHSNDVLTVVNEEILADLVIRKTFPESDLVPTSVKVDVTGPNGYSETFTLGSGNNFEVTVKDLSLGEYIIKEQDASRDGYALTVKYNGQTQEQATVTLTEENDNTAAVVNIQNTYLQDKHNPASFTVKKVDAQTGLPLEGAVFGLYDPSGTLVGEEKTTDANGEVTFGPFDSAAEYTLKEISAPLNYHATDATWTVTVSLKNGQVEVKLNADKNAFENIYDWIVDVVTGLTGATWRDGVLTVPNVIKTGSLTITKQVTDSEGLYANAEYSFTLDCSNDAFDKTFTLKAGGSLTIRDIPWGTTYTLTEEATGAAFTSAVTDSGNGKISAQETRIDVTNTYAYVLHNEPLSLVKVDADDNTKVIPGAGFTLYADVELETQLGQEVFSDENGQVALPIESAGTYYLAETTTPAGYHPNPVVYTVTAEEKAVVKNSGTDDAVTEIQMHIRIAGFTGTTSNEIDYTYLIENTAIKTLEVNVGKIWEDENYYARPEAVDVILYRNNEKFETVTLNADNDWSYSWTDLTDEYTWSVDEAKIPAEYAKTVANDGNDWTITNSRTPNPVEITVTKAWNHNGGKNLPESIPVTLFKDGEAYNTVELNEENDWTYTWTGLTDASQWSVDETEVPAGYTKKIKVDGFKFEITNTRTIKPVEVTVTKVWAASEGVILPESVEAILYRDGKRYDTVVLNEENHWTYIWTGLTDEYTWSVDEKTVPEGYTKNVTSEGYDFTITNTRNASPIEVSVTKVWYGADVTHPTSVKVTLYRDGKAYDTVTLSADNNWSYTWKDLTDEFQWTVDEPSVPSGYNKLVRRSGYSFTITNTHVDNPKTGDFTSLFGMGTMAAIGTVGFGISAMTLLAKRKKEDEEQ